jgi:hypothetical protein
MAKRCRPKLILRHYKQAGIALPFARDGMGTMGAGNQKRVRNTHYKVEAPMYLR